MYLLGSFFYIEGYIGLSHQEEGIVQEAELPLGGQVNSNIVSLRTKNGHLLAIGLKDNRLRIMKLNK